MKTKSKLMRLLIVGLVFVVILSCGPDGDGDLPTVTPVPPTKPPTKATSVPVQTPAAGETPQPPPPPTDDRQVRQNLLRSTVQIVALVDNNGSLQPIWSGSGTILSPDGLILTNYHVAVGYELQPDALGVALTVKSDEPPEPTYFAEVRAADAALDLAVIQITAGLDNRPVDPDQLNLTYVPIGDSDVLELGDLIQIFGYPGIGGETITFTEGSVSGFTREMGIDGRAWIKTDATIAGGNSGGLAASDVGKIIGVPTRAGYGQAGPDEFADCRYLADTNGDGVINEDDTCIPVGGFINALRPVNLAKPLVEAARLGIAPRPDDGPGPVPPSGDARFYNLAFSPDVTENDQPTQIVTQLPSGATGIYLFWDYEGMTDGVVWEARWYRDGEFLENASKPAGPWQGGEQGFWWNGIVNSNGLTDGTYKVELYVANEILAQASIPVGGAVATGASITNLIFSDGVTDDDRPTNPTYLLPSGITTVYAFFDYANMQDGMQWTRTWYYEGEQALTKTEAWGWGASGSAWISAGSQSALNPGAYRLELFVEGKLVAAANFTIAGTQSQQAIGPITFAAGVDARGNPVNPGTSFPAGQTELYFFCDYAGMQDGMAFDERWLLEGEEIVTFNQTWESGESGTFHDYIYLTSGNALPEGTYTLELYVEGQKVQTASASIGTGTPPPPPPPPAEGLYVYGYVLDADTGKGIPGALFVVLKPGVTIEAWGGSEADIYTSAETDANGYFELPDPLERGKNYSMIVWAEGYRATGGDNIPIGDEPSPYEMDITLQRE